MKRIIIILLFLCLNTSFAYSRENLRELFKNNKAVIYAINIRNFAAVDKNLDGIITPEKGDIGGTFLNAKDRLKDLKYDGINTIYLLPITPVGKLKSLGTAGSLYALDSFSKINPQLDDTKNKLSVYDEAKEFVNEAHKQNLNVIVDMPCCGSYDLSTRKPDWFVFDKNEKPFTPCDWSDVRLFRTYNPDGSLFMDNINNYKEFVDLMLSLNIDGIRADVAAIKPFAFWKNLIDYTRSKNPDFLFLAEANPDWSNPVPEVIRHYSTIEELLLAGFDSYYGSFGDFKNIETRNDFNSRVDKNLKILKRNKEKSVISAFATHDQQAPILKGANYWNMVLWLSVSLPLNTYFLDGFSVGDNYIYPYENKKAPKTYTDDEYYFVHNGQFDIFNFSGPIRAKYPDLKKSYLKAIDFKERNIDLINSGKFQFLNTDNDKVFAYSIRNFDRQLIVVGSLDQTNRQSVSLKSVYLKKDYLFSLINTKYRPNIEKNTINTTLEPLELQVYMVSLAKYRAM